MKHTTGIIWVQIQNMTCHWGSIKRCCVHVQPNSDLASTHSSPSPWGGWRFLLEENVLYLYRMYQSNEKLSCSWKKQNTSTEGIKEWKKPQPSKILFRVIIHFIPEWLIVCLCFCAQQSHESWHYTVNLQLHRTSSKTTHENIKWVIDKEVQEYNS